MKMKIKTKKTLYMAKIYITTMTDVIMDTCYQCAGLETALRAGESKPAESQTVSNKQSYKKQSSIVLVK